MLTAGFAESGIIDMNAPFPNTRPSITDYYDYTSDSDLESEEDDEEPFLLGVKKVCSCILHN